MRYSELIESKMLSEGINNAKITSAIKLKNYLVQTYGVTYHRPYLPSNPYSDVQQLSISGDAGVMTKLRGDLEAAGWISKDTSSDELWYLVNPENKDVTIRISTERATIFGPKKAKRSNLPYYD